jgi:hypothetical protein
VIVAKDPTSPNPLPQERFIFCVECGTQLENFCFSKTVNDLEAIRKTLAQCKKQGRFVGEYCSKLFIAGRNELGPPHDDEPPAEERP